MKAYQSNGGENYNGQGFLQKKKCFGSFGIGGLLNIPCGLTQAVFTNVKCEC